MTNELKPDQKLLVSQAQDGSDAAMGALFDLYYERVANYAFRRVLDYDDAQDITAQVFLQIVRGLKGFKWQHEHSFSGWVFKIASNEVNQHLRKSKRVIAVEDLELEELASRSVDDDSHRSIEHQLDLNQKFVELHAAIAQLKDKQQNLIHLHYFEHLSHREISIALSMKEGTVRVAVHRAVEELRTKVKSNNQSLLTQAVA